MKEETHENGYLGDEEAYAGSHGSQTGHVR